MIQIQIHQTNRQTASTIFICLDMFGQFVTSFTRKSWAFEPPSRRKRKQRIPQSPKAKAKDKAWGPWSILFREMSCPAFYSSKAQKFRSFNEVLSDLAFVRNLVACDIHNSLVLDGFLRKFSQIRSVDPFDIVLCKKKGHFLESHEIPRNRMVQDIFIYIY